MHDFRWWGNLATFLSFFSRIARIMVFGFVNEAPRYIFLSKNVKIVWGDTFCDNIDYLLLACREIFNLEDIPVLKLEKSKS